MKKNNKPTMAISLEELCYVRRIATDSGLKVRGVANLGKLSFSSIEVSSINPIESSIKTLLINSCKNASGKQFALQEVPCQGLVKKYHLVKFA